MLSDMKTELEHKIFHMKKDQSGKDSEVEEHFHGKHQDHSKKVLGEHHDVACISLKRKKTLFKEGIDPRLESGGLS